MSLIPEMVGLAQPFHFSPSWSGLHSHVTFPLYGKECFRIILTSLVLQHCCGRCLCLW